MNRAFALLLALTGGLALAQREVVIGASIPQTGSLAGFGAYQKWGFEQAVKEVNARGGLQLGGNKVPVRLVLYDDQSRPELAAQNTERLITRDNVTALLGGWTPPLAISDATVAEREGVPIVVSAPLRAVMGANKNPWRWVSNIFFDELQMTDQQFLTMNTVASNKKVALFTDNEQDGVVMGGLWNDKAKKFGYNVVYHAKFPVGTTDYGDLIRNAKAAGAEVVIAQMIPPDAIALRKQMLSLNYRPRAIFFEKGGEPVEFAKALGPNADGIMVAAYWHPSLKYPGAATLRQQFEAQTKLPYGQAIAVAKTAAQVLLDAIERAGSTDPRAINDAIGKTGKTYVGGPVRFNVGPGNRSAALPIFMSQWQKGQPQIVFPKNLATAKIIYPLK